MSESTDGPAPKRQKETEPVSAATPADEAAGAGGPAAAVRPDYEDGKTNLEGCKFEYLDHTADVQVHSWGETLKESFEQQVLGMFGYMTELSTVTIDESATIEFEVEGSDLGSLLYALMDEFLFQFSTEPNLVCREVNILEFDQTEFKIKVQGKGETFDLAKHPQGTEIKAITYSEMQIHTKAEGHDVYVIVDI